LLEAAVFVGSDETIVSEDQLLLDAVRRLVLQIGGANIASPPTSSSLADKKRVCSLLLNTARRWGWCSLRSRAFEARRGRDPNLIAPLACARCVE
jgi:hypothetical protein